MHRCGDGGLSESTGEACDDGKKTPLFCAILYPKRSFYQDRLGTNIGKSLKKEMRFLTGNVLDGDGCDAHCQLEPLPAGHARILSEWRQRWMPREDIHAEILSLEVLAGKKTRLFAMQFVY